MKPTTRTGVIRTASLVLVLGLLAFVWSSTRGGAAQRYLDVHERDFAIKAPAHIATGDLVLRVTNTGPETHELFLVRADGRSLPLRRDDLTVDEEGVKGHTLAQLESIQPGTVRTWKLRLAPGRYTLFCNMSGHYLGGMHRKLIVR
jgi:uncharacterized cupredoxin-like copper-binding protein